MIFLSITKIIITTEGVYLLHTEQDKKQIKIITLGKLNRRAEDIDTFIKTSEKQYSDKIAAAADSIAQCHNKSRWCFCRGRPVRAKPQRHIA